MFRCLLVIVCAAVVAPLSAQEPGLRVPPGFKATLYADHTLANDIYAMTLDDQGRVIVSSRGWVKRLLDTDGDGKADKAEQIAQTKRGAMGLWCSGTTLYMFADGKFSVTRIDSGSAFAAPQDTYAALNFGEHGGHAMRRGPDGCFYLMAGNDAGIQRSRLAPSSPIKTPEAGGILRFSKDMKKVDCVAHGFRNPYRFDFTPLGDIITYDSDTERDFLFPWYSPTRIYHVAFGQHHGWRLPGYTRSLARPDYYADTVDMLAPIGRGSPTGVVCYRHVQFPKRYRGGAFALDWTFGKIWFVPLDPKGSTYATKPEVFLEPAGIDGFAPTDACVAPDGSLFVCIGGRGTRGAVYRIEYVGTKEEPREEYREPDSRIEKVLGALQPLDVWSRAKWEFLARDLGNAKIMEHALQGPSERRIRAIEIMNDLYYGVTLVDAKKILETNPPWPVRARLAWSLGRDFWPGAENVLLELAGDNEPPVRLAALDAIADLLQAPPRFKDADKKLPAVVVKSLGDRDKRVRLAAGRIATMVLGKTLNDLLETSELRARLEFAVSEYRNPTAPIGNLHEHQKIALEALQSDDAGLRLDALRLLMLVDGDWRLQNPPEEVSSAYALQTPHKRLPYQHLDEKIRQQLHKIYPTGDQRLDHETARYLAMIQDDDAATIGKVLAHLTKESTATDDLHHLIVLSRLKGKPTVEQSKRVVDALFGLDNKLAGQQLRIKQNWGPRLGEIVFNLTLRYPKMAHIMLSHPAFVHPAHVGYAGPFATENGVTAAQLFLTAVKKDNNFEWSPELVELLATLPPGEYRPLFRKQWSDYSLRDALLRHLVDAPEESDRPLLLDRLDSSQKSNVLACLAALEKLPRDESAKNLAPILRRLRLGVQEPKEGELRTKLLALLNRQSEQDFTIREASTELLHLKQAYEPVFTWFEKTHPAEAKLLRGDDEDAEHWQKTLAAVKWETGNAERGLKIFRERSCLACHTGSSRIGPDLVGTAGRFSRDDLFTAIIYPSRDVAPAYRVHDIETRDGRNFSGIVVFESADGLIVQLDAVKTVRIDSANLASRQPGRKSLMPTGLLKDLKPVDLADLYSYLRSLK